MSYTPPPAKATNLVRGMVKLGGTDGDLPTVAKVNGVAVTGTPQSNYVLTASSASAASWAPASAGSAATTTTSGTVTLAGDLSGSATAPTVARVNGVTVTGTPQSNYVLTASSATAASWSPAQAGAVATTTTNGTITLAGDLSGSASSPTVARINGVSVTGTPAAGQVPVASSGTAAAWGTVNDTTAVKLAGGTMTGKLVVPTFQFTGGTPAVGEVLTSDATGNATWQIAPGAYNIVTPTANVNYSAANRDYVLMSNPSAAVTVTLPAKSAGAVVCIKKIGGGANTITVKPFEATGVYIDGMVNDAIDINYMSKDYLCDGTNWYLI